MKSFYVVFFSDKKAVCGTWVRDDDKEWAMISAEFKLMCKYPNVKYDDVKVVNVAD